MMTTKIVDTNIPLVANGSCEGVSNSCRLAAMDFLEDLLHKGNIAVDVEGDIEYEYRNQLGVGQPGVGNRFLQKFFTEAAHRVVREHIHMDKDGHSRHFRFDGNLKKFDRSDRKFVVLAAVTGHTIYNATDSDWLEHQAELTKRKIRVEFICGCDKRRWFST